MEEDDGEEEEERRKGRKEGRKVGRKEGRKEGRNTTRGRIEDEEEKRRQEGQRKGNRRVVQHVVERAVIPGETKRIPRALSAVNAAHVVTHLAPFFLASRYLRSRSSSSSTITSRYIEPFRSNGTTSPSALLLLLLPVVLRSRTPSTVSLARFG